MDLPATVTLLGNLLWYKHGVIHRETGPAVRDRYGLKEDLWYFEGRRMSQEEHTRKVALRKRALALIHEAIWNPRYPWGRIRALLSYKDSYPHAAFSQ